MENTQPMPCGKMYQAHSVQTTAKTSASSSKNSAKLKEVTPLFLDLRSGVANGATQDLSWEMGIPSHGECLMHNFGAYPSVAEESSLLSILEADVPEKYSLSETACRGILRRAANRGNELPSLLRLALMQKCGMLAGTGTETSRPQSQETTTTE